MKEPGKKWPYDYLNLKCVIYTIYIALSYWYLFSKKSKLIHYISFLIVNYFLINWYNYQYQCYHNNIIINSVWAVLTSLVFYYLPKGNKIVLAFLLYVPYLILAWYDYLMNCTFRMNPTIFPFGRFIYLPMKPDPYKRRFDELDPIVVENIVNFDKYVGVGLVSALVIYITFKYIK